MNGSRPVYTYMCMQLASISDTSFLQILMNVLTPVKITVALMPTAMILLEVITVHVTLVTLETATHVMVSLPL